MKADKSDAFEIFLRQATRNYSPPSFPRTGESPAPGQWFHCQQAPTGRALIELPYLTPPKVQMHKCERCSQEFISPINYRRHMRLHRRSVNFDKETRSYRDLLGAFWDKLSEDEVKEVASLQDISLKEIAGSSLVHALATVLGTPGFWTLPRVYVNAGSKLLEITGAKRARLPVASQELFSILDDASERTFLCAGTAESVQKYVFDGDAAKVCFDSINLIACTSFLFEQKLVKAWAADKDAEALRCQNLLVEEEEATQKKKAELLERKKLKKLRQKEQKARGQSENGNLIPASSFEVPLPEVSSLPAPSTSCSNNDVLPEVSNCLELVQSSSNEDIGVETQHDLCHQHLDKRNLEIPAGTFEVPLPEVSTLPSPSDSYSNNPDVSPDISTCLELVQISSKEDRGIKSQHDLCHQHLDVVRIQDVESQSVSANSQQRFPDAQQQARKSPTFGKNSLNNNKNHQAMKVQPIQKHKDSGVSVNSSQIWTRKVSPDDSSTLEVQKEAIDQKQSNPGVMIGSITIPVKDYPQHQGNCPAEARDDFGCAEPLDTFQIESDRAAVKIWRPVRHEAGKEDPEEVAMSSNSQSCLQSCPMDNSGSWKNCQVPDGNAHEDLLWSNVVTNAKAFLAQRWREAIAGDYVTLVLLSPAGSPDRSPDPEFAEQPDVPNSSSEAALASDRGEQQAAVSGADDQLAKDEVLNSSSSGNSNAKSRRKPEKAYRMKYIPKQKKH